MLAISTRPALALATLPLIVSLANPSLAILPNPFSDNLVIDTGSSITWVGAQTPYVISNTSKKTSNSVVSIVFCPASSTAQTNTYGLVRTIWHCIILWYVSLVSITFAIPTIHFRV